MKSLKIHWDNPEPDYGGNVIPVMKLYASLKNTEEKRLFQDALEALLSSPDENIRAKAVNQCLGFFAFRNAI